MNTVSPVNYDVIAPKYDARYAQNPLAGVSRELRELVTKSRARDVLEVGCGTGHWVIELHPLVQRIVGLDFSFGMLEQARIQSDALLLTNGDANYLPFPSGSFDLVLSLNALQHYADQRAFITEARRLLRPSGALAIVNLDPHIGRDQWYLYDYFEGVKATDLRRFPSSGTLLDWMLGCPSRVARGGSYPPGIRRAGSAGQSLHAKGWLLSTCIDKRRRLCRGAGPHPRRHRQRRRCTTHLHY